MDPRTPDDEGYVIRYGLNLSTRMTLIIGVVAAVSLLWWRFDPTLREDGLGLVLRLVFQMAIVAMAAGASLRQVSFAARRAVVVRVDREGITLETLRFERRRRQVHFGWDDVAEVVLFARYGSIGAKDRFPYLGVRLRPDARSTATTLDPDDVRKLMKQVTNVPKEVLARSRPFNTRRLDERGLCEAVARYASHVRVVRLDKTGRLRRVRVA